MNAWGTPENLNRGGNEGNRFGAGRKRDEWKAACAEIASSEDVLSMAREILKDKSHPAWLGAWKFVAEQAYGKAERTVEHSGEFTPMVLVLSPEEAARL